MATCVSLVVCKQDDLCKKNEELEARLRELTEALHGYHLDHSHKLKGRGQCGCGLCIKARAALSGKKWRTETIPTDQELRDAALSGKKELSNVERDNRTFRALFKD